VFELPTVLRADELLDKAFGRAGKATTAKGKDRATRSRNLAVAKVQIAGQTIGSTLRSYVKGFPSLDRLPPFYAELIDVLVDRGRLKKHLGAVDWAADRAEAVTREAVRKIGRSELGELLTLRKAAFGRLASLVDQVSGDLDGLVEARKALRRLPNIDPNVPTIVVAGYPNVGKSAFVRAVSTGRPRVAEYPFTTKGVSLGHFERDGRRYQIIDTPGLLDRPMEKRNRIERQAIAALAHLADVVLFLLDPSETCGYTIDEQTRLLASVQDVFRDVAFVVVENKADLDGPASGHPRISAVRGDGLNEALDRVLERLTSRAPGGAPR